MPKKHLTEQQIISAVKKQVGYLLSDWSKNISNYTFVKDDFLDRIEKGLPLYLKNEQTK